MGAFPATFGRGRRMTGKRRRRRRIAGRTVLYVIAWLVATLTLLPLIYAVLGGFRTTAQIAADPIGLPSPWVLSNYTDLLQSSTFLRELFNSALIALVSTILVVPLAALAAYVFARFAFRGRELFYTLFTLGLLFPVAIAIMPIFIMVRNLGLLDNPLGVALPQAAFGLPMTIIILRPFFRSIPDDLQDAAAIDGAGPLRFFWKILIPLSRPVLATVSVLAIVGSWNAFLLPLVVLTDSDQWTLPLGVTNYSQQYTADIARILAFTTLSMVPALVFYAFAERQLIRGLTSGAVKG
ncbi:MAG TPA: carbohydrate ABC transporter permease [Solirubrobacteraceae bacterium]|nr:carbohydrate ABC transporter permease [Solirubrobacteraceae bacterium]